MGSLASASMGTAIAGLNDAAATNAILAAGGTADLGKATLLDKTLKILIDMPLLRENGTLTEESGKAIIKIEGNHALFLQ